MGGLIILIIAFLFSLLSAFSSARFHLHIRKNTARIPRGLLGNAAQILAQQLIVASFIVIVATIGGFDLYDLGASRTFSPLPAFVVGFAVYFAVLGLLEALAALTGYRERLHDLSYETMRLIWPRDQLHKFMAIIAVCVLNPFTEEVIYRGVLVYYLGGFIGSLYAAVLIGLTLSIAAHLYQGFGTMPFQLVFHGAAIMLLLSPFGLVACFGFHFAGDLVPVVTLRPSMIAWRERRRKERLAAVTASR